MLNYHKTYRQSLEKSKRKPTPKKQHTINRSHTSSINLKLPQQLSQFDPLKVSIKNYKQSNAANSTTRQKKQKVDHSGSHSKSKSNLYLKQDKENISNSQMKYSFKIKHDPEQEGTTSRTRMKTNYEQISRPFQDSNRCLITDRHSKGPEYKLAEKSRSKKNGIQLKTQYKDISEPFDKFYQFQQTELKMRKQMSTKHTAHSINTNSNNSNQFVKVPLSELKALYDQCKNYEQEMSQLQKQLQFYRKISSKKTTKNSIALALAE